MPPSRASCAWSGSWIATRRAAWQVAGCTTRTGSSPIRRGGCGLGRLMRRTLDPSLYREQSPSDTWEAEWLSGAFLMIRREAFNEVGLFDEGFVKYFEDVDMCLRMARAGWKVLYYGGTQCYHLERRASKNLLSVDAMRHL